MDSIHSHPSSISLRKRKSFDDALSKNRTRFIWPNNHNSHCHTNDPKKATAGVSNSAPTVAMVTVPTARRGSITNNSTLTSPCRQHRRQHQQNYYREFNHDSEDEEEGDDVDREMTFDRHLLPTVGDHDFILFHRRQPFSSLSNTATSANLTLDNLFPDLSSFP